MHSPLEWEQAGFNDEVDGNNVFLIEWPEQAASQLPSADIEIDLVILNEGRTATLRALSPKGVGCLKRF
jgi:tRNA threonylcarbamoyladenosine biosynthesis protein TsaE